jgi:rhodanese-related sulfurtransferase
MKTTLIASAIAVFAAISSLAAEVDCSDETNFPNIEKQELTQLIEKKAVTVVDVNGEDSFKKARIPTAVHYGTVKKDFASVLPKDKSALIVAYCGGPKCTAWEKAAEDACKMGYTNIRHFKGGISGWTKS